VKELPRLFGEVFRLSLPYFRSEDRRAGLILLSAVIRFFINIFFGFILTLLFIL